MTKKSAAEKRCLNVADSHDNSSASVINIVVGQQEDTINDDVTQRQNTLAADELNQKSSKVSAHRSTLRMQVQNVPEDGNCMFAAICVHLEKATLSTLRNDVANFMTDNSERYKEFVIPRFETENIANADTC